MINIKELRIGNVIENSDGVKVVDIDILNEIHADPEKYAPVKVDNDWLEKFQIPLQEDREYEMCSWQTRSVGSNPPYSVRSERRPWQRDIRAPPPRPRPVARPGVRRPVALNADVLTA